MASIRTKKHRLPEAAYRGRRHVAFTANEENRRPLFRDTNVVSALLTILQEQSARYECLVGVYCFMPDHLHLVLCGQSESADAKRAMDGFKHKSGLWLAEHHPQYHWQGDYYDHIIRASDDWRRQVFYIYNNPVRAGFVESGAEWPHTGSIGFDLQELLLDAAW